MNTTSFFSKFVEVFASVLDGPPDNHIYAHLRGYRTNKDHEESKNEATLPEYVRKTEDS